MHIGEALASALGTCVDCAHSVATRIGFRFEPVNASAARVPHAGMAAIPDLDPARAMQAHGDEARFHVDLRAPARRSSVRMVTGSDRGELPGAYGYDRVVLLPRDPWSAFAYWEITPATRVDAARRFGAYGDGAHDVLRVYDVRAPTAGGHEAALSFDVDLPAGVASWYLRLPRPAWSYHVEIGFRLPGGGFLPVARSGAIVSPPTTPARDDTVRWVTLGDHTGEDPPAGGGPHPSPVITGTA